MTSLYEIADAHKGLVKMVEDGELTKEDVEDTMELMEGDFSDKALSIVAVKENMESDISEIDSAIARLQDRKKAIKKQQESMIEYLRTNMERTGITNIKCPLFSITLAKGRDVLKIDNQALIPTEYIETEITSVPQKREILAAMKAGEKIEGCSIVKSKTSVRIK